MKERVSSTFLRRAVMRKRADRLLSLGFGTSVTAHDADWSIRMIRAAFHEATDDLFNEKLIALSQKQLLNPDIKAHRASDIRSRIARLTEDMESANEFLRTAAPSLLADFQSVMGAGAKA